MGPKDFHHQRGGNGSSPLGDQPHIVNSRRHTAFLKRQTVPADRTSGQRFALRHHQGLRKPSRFNGISRPAQLDGDRMGIRIRHWKRSRNFERTLANSG